MVIMAEAEKVSLKCQNEKACLKNLGVANSQKPWKANLFNLPRDLKSWSTKLL